MELSIKLHINSMVKISFLRPGNIANILNYVNLTEAEHLIHAFTTSKIDYVMLRLLDCLMIC